MQRTETIVLPRSTACAREGGDRGYGMKSLMRRVREEGGGGDVCHIVYVVATGRITEASVSGGKGIRHGFESASVVTYTEGDRNRTSPGFISARLIIPLAPTGAWLVIRERRCGHFRSTCGLLPPMVSPIQTARP